MNMLNFISEFYSNLSSDGVFFFWIVVFLFVFLFFLLLVLLFKNRKLEKLLSENRDNEIAQTPVYTSIIKENTSDNNSNILKEEVGNSNIENASNSSDNILNKDVLVQGREEVKDNTSSVRMEEENKENSVVSSSNETGAYKKNVLREISMRQTSPINIDKKEDSTSLMDEIYLREDNVSPLEELEDNFEVNDSMKFASDIVKQMEEEVRPSNIELTEYEKKQEEEAIISYGELLQIKDKIYNITEDEDTTEFIDELKSFRLDL